MGGAGEWLTLEEHWMTSMDRPLTSRCCTTPRTSARYSNPCGFADVQTPARKGKSAPIGIAECRLPIAPGQDISRHNFRVRHDRRHMRGRGDDRRSEERRV